MHISKRTIEVLKNFSTINPSLVIKNGNVLSTVTPAKNILSSVEVDEKFDNEFGIYDLSKFLGVLSLTEDSNIDFSETYMTIEGGKNSIRYTYAEPSQIIQPPSSQIKLPSIEASFKLLNTDLDKVLRAASIMQLPNLAFEGDGTKITLKAFSEKDPTSNVSEVELAPTDKVFSAIFKVDSFKFLVYDYDVELSASKISKFSADSGKVLYWVALESTSTFG